MNALERITEVLRKARIAGGWLDEDVAAVVLEKLGLDNEGHQAGSKTEPPDQSGEPDDRASDGLARSNSVRN